MTTGTNNHNPQASSRDAVSESTPLLSSNVGAAADQNTKFSTNATSSASTTPVAIDPVTVYVRVLQEHLPWNQRPSALWILPAFLLPAISAGMIISSLGQFHAVLLCREYMNHHSGANSTALTLVDFMSRSLAGVNGDGGWVAAMSPAAECQAAEVQAYTAKALGALELLGAVASMGTMTTGYYCSLSDKHGRLKIMMVGFGNTIFTLVCMYSMSRWWDEIGMKLMVLTVTVGGLLGGLMQNSALCLAYAADCTEPAKRSLVFSWLHAGTYMGLAVGPYIGGLIVKKTGSFMTIVLIDGVASVISLLLVAFVLPESILSKQPAHIQRLYEEALIAASLPPSGNIQNNNNKINLLGALSFFKPSAKNVGLIIMGTINFLTMMTFKGSFSIIILYTNLMFSWGEYEDGILFSLASIVRFLSLVVLLPILNHAYRKHTSTRSRLHKKTDYNEAGDDINQQILSNSYSRDTINSDDTAIEQSHHSGTVSNNVVGGGSSKNNRENRGTDMHPTPLAVDLDDPIVASRIEHFGEAALNLSDDEAPFQERRRRRSTEETLIPWRTDGSPDSSKLENSMPGKKPLTPEQLEEREKKYWDIKFDTWILRVGFIVNAITYVGYGLATNTWLFILAASLHAVSIITSPSLKTLLTSLVEPSQFGAVLGAFQIVESAAGVFSPLVISWVYALTVKSFPEFVWYCCAFLTGICAILAFMIRQKQFRHTDIV